MSMLEWSSYHIFLWDFIYLQALCTERRGSKRKAEERFLKWKLLAAHIPCSLLQKYFQISGALLIPASPQKLKSEPGTQFAYTPNFLCITMDFTCNPRQIFMLRDLDGLLLFGFLEPNLDKEGTSAQELEQGAEEEEMNMYSGIRESFPCMPELTSKQPYYGHLKWNVISVCPHWNPLFNAKYLMYLERQ